MSPGRHTTAIVGALMGSALLFLAFYLTSWKVGLFLSIMLAYEGWTLVNSHRADTISESVWRLATRPLMPWLFGLATGWAMTSGMLQEPWLILTAGFMNAHFFWQRQEVYLQSHGGETTVTVKVEEKSVPGAPSIVVS